MSNREPTQEPRTTFPELAKVLLRLAYPERDEAWIEEHAAKVEAKVQAEMKRANDDDSR